MGIQWTEVRNGAVRLGALGEKVRRQSQEQEDDTVPGVLGGTGSEPVLLWFISSLASSNTSFQRTGEQLVKINP